MCHMHSKNMFKPIPSDSDMIKSTKCTSKCYGICMLQSQNAHSFTWPAKATGTCALIHTELLGKKRKKVSFFLF